jgi:hypothetical protein
MILNNKTLCHFLLSNYACREYTKSVSHPFSNTRWKYNRLNSISAVIQNLVICFYVFTYKWRHWFLFRHSFQFFYSNFCPIDFQTEHNYTWSLHMNYSFPQVSQFSWMRSLTSNEEVALVHWLISQSGKCASLSSEQSASSSRKYHSSKCEAFERTSGQKLNWRN